MWSGSIERNLISLSQVDNSISSISATYNPNPSILDAFIWMVVAICPEVACIREYFPKNSIRKLRVTRFDQIRYELTVKINFAHCSVQ